MLETLQQYFFHEKVIIPAISGIVVTAIVLSLRSIHSLIARILSNKFPKKICKRHEEIMSLIHGRVDAHDKRMDDFDKKLADLPIIRDGVNNILGAMGLKALPAKAGAKKRPTIIHPTHEAQ